MSTRRVKIIIFGIVRLVIYELISPIFVTKVNLLFDIEKVNIGFISLIVSETSISISDITCYMNVRLFKLRKNTVI